MLADKGVTLFQQPGKVLVVDDNVDTAETLSTFLRSQGFAVSTAYDGRSALSAFETTEPSVVLLDIGLPDISGREVAVTMLAAVLMLFWLPSLDGAKRRTSPHP